MGTSEVNINLQQNNNYMCIIKGDELFNSDDIVFYIQTFTTPNISLQAIEMTFNGLTIPYPSLGKMTYSQLELSLLVDDNLNSYVELLSWMHRIKNPEKLLIADPNQQFDVYQPKQNKLNAALDSSKQYPIETRDIHILITDTNHQVVKKFLFTDAWISNLTGMELNSTTSDYITTNATLYYTIMYIYDEQGNRLVPPLDFDQDQSMFDVPIEDISGD
jgi:hypothetical protein